MANILARLSQINIKSKKKYLIVLSTITFLVIIVVSFVFYKSSDVFKLNKSIEDYNTKSVETLVKNPELSKQFAIKAYLTSLKTNNQKSLAISLDNIGNYFDYIKNNDSAIFYHKKALEIYEKLGYSIELANSYNQIGLNKWRSGLYLEAIDYYKKSEFVSDIIKSPERQVRVSNNIGVAYYNIGRYSVALSYYLHSLELFDKYKFVSGRLFLLDNIGLVYQKLGDFDKAYSYFEIALKESQKLSKKKSLSYAYQCMGGYYFHKKEYDKSLECYNNSIKYGYLTDAQIPEPIILANIARIYSINNNNNEALKYFYSALNNTRLSRNKSIISIIHVNMAQHYLKCKNFDLAKRYLDSTYNYAKEQRLLDVLMDYYETQYKLAKAQNQLQQSLKYHLLYSEVKDSIASLETAKQVSQLQEIYDFEKHKREIQLKDSEILRNNDLISRQTTLLYVAIFFIVIVLIFSTLVTKQYKFIKKVFHLLVAQNIAISEQKSNLEIAKNEADEANKTKDKLFSIIAHDLRNPLFALHQLSGILITDFKDFDENQVHNYLKMIEDSANSSYKLLENLLDWSRSQIGNIKTNPQNILLDEILTEQIGLYSALANHKNLTISKKIDSDTYIFADKDLISTVFRNLISNAIKFTPQSGYITINTEQTTNFVVISVADSGIGISKEQRENIFTLNLNKSSYGTDGERGTGLGLILCKEFIEKNNGKIEIENNVPQGTIFKVYLPFQ